jgi:hypothetical protein
MDSPQQGSPAHGSPRSDSPDLVGALSAHLGCRLTPHEFWLPEGTRVAVDGADGEPPSLLVQCTRVQGQLKSSHRNKVIADAFKLLWLRDSVFAQAQPVLALSPEFARLCGPGAWLTAALQHWRIAAVFVSPTGEISTPITFRDSLFTNR